MGNPRSWRALLAITLPAAIAAAGGLRGIDPPETSPPSAQAPVPQVRPADPSPTSDADPPEVVVFLKDGQVITGILVEATASRIALRVAGIDTTFPASSVDRYRLLPPVLERYEEMRRAAGDNPDLLVRLAEWLRARERYELALLEAERALAIDPNHAEARRLATLLSRQVELKRKSKQASRPAADTRQSDSRAAARRPRDFPLLTDSQVNLIKVYEVNLAQPLRLIIRRDTITRLLACYAGHPLIPVTQEAREAIYRRSEREILEIMFRLQAREFYGEVRVLDQPESMRMFRDNVHGKWLMNRCATTLCHGGEEAGRLMLCNAKPGLEATFYTNFLILDRFRLEDGSPLINYDHPERSPLLHLGLPREDSLWPHPPVLRTTPGSRAERDLFIPAFRSQDDRQFREAVEWIRAMYRPRPNYPIDYTPPGASVAAARGQPDDSTPAAPAPQEPVKR
jgi:hypothetical protein